MGIFKTNLLLNLLPIGAAIALSSCTPFDKALNSVSGSVNDAEGYTKKVTLTGTGITRDMIPGCTPQPLTDFNETEVATARRVLPKNCSVVGVATPVLSWVQPVTYKADTNFVVHIKAELPVSNTFDATYTTKVPRLLVPVTLPPGTYIWTVAYTKGDGSTVQGQGRRFAILTRDLFSIPTAAAMADLVLAKSHPRILATGASFAAIAAKAKGGDYKSAFENYVTMAATYVTKPIPDVPQNLTLADFGNDQDKFDAWKHGLRNQILDESMYVQNLGFAYYFTGNVAYRDAAIHRLQSLAAWPTNGATSEAVQDQVNREIYLLLAIGLDLFQDHLNEAAQQPIRNAIVTTLKNRLAQTNFASFNRYPYDSHLLTAVLYATEAMMYAAGTPGLSTDTGKADLMKFWDLATTTLGSWGGALDGGYANGGGYGWYETAEVARFMAATRLVAGIDLTRVPAAGNAGDAQLALSAPLDNIRQAFGDEADNTEHYKTYSGDTSRLFALVTGKPEQEWYWRQKPENLANKWLFSPIHFMMLGSSATPVEPSTVPAVANSFLFEDAGYVALHSKTTDLMRTSLYFRSSRFGSFNHSHADQNAFTFASKGKDLLISGGVYDGYMTSFHKLVTRATRFKNALTFDGGIGQAEPTQTPIAPGAPIESMDANGKLVNFYDNGAWAVATGDATNAYTALLTAAYRTVAYNRNEHVAVIYDYASSSVARTWELNFQTLTANNPVVSDGILKLVNAPASACIQVYGPEGSYAITNGFPLTPIKATDSQSQVRFSTKKKSQAFTSVTVIREDCRTVPVSMTLSGAAATIRLANTVLTANGLTVVVP